MFKPVDEQLAYLRKGCAEIIQEDELRARLERSRRDGRPLKVKVGFDPTAPDLHLGHTVILRKMKHFQDMGHDVVFLIGDPTGRNTTRPPLAPETIAQNAETYKAQVYKILDRERTTIDFNSRWLGALSSADIIKLCAKYTVARILERDDFTNRMKSGLPISMHEILYPLYQAYDSVALRCDVEMGGTDQKFNLLVGREIQREYGQDPQIVITVPLLEGLDGVEKMSKSLGNYIGITDPPGEIFGKVMSVSDPLMFRYYELLTDVPQTTLDGWKKEAADGRLNPRDLKVGLAKLLITDFWGPAAAEDAAAEFERVFRKKDLPSDLEEKVLPRPERGQSSLELIGTLVGLGLVPSRGEAKRLIGQGGLYLDGERVSDIAARLDISAKKEFILKIGKIRFYKLVARD